MEEITRFIERAQADVEEIKGRLATVRGEPQPDQEMIRKLERELRSSEQDLDRGRREIDQRGKAEKELEALQVKLKDQEGKLFDVEAQINDLLARDVVAQKFKSQISLYFAVLVGFMILCFFGVAFYDERVRVTIFSGQAGMQFVTLFSVVIAIILFGITGILGDKELAALLGGLSGYILGRYTRSEQAGGG